MIRSRGEVSAVNGDTRFQVRTGRVGVKGNISPRISYKAELDLCDRGSTKVTDVWGRFAFGRGFAIQAGQMRMPFTFGSTRAPHSYLFANRPFVDKQMLGPRNAGIKGAYKCPSFPISFEAGVFNATSLTDHNVWQKRLAFASKALCDVGNVTFITGFESLSPSTVRINLVNCGATWRYDRWMVEGEYIYKHFTNGSFEAAHGYNLMADYAMPLNTADFNRLSFQGRWDGITNNSNGLNPDNGMLPLTDPARNRVTVGATISYIQPKVKADIKLNYEQYFYHKGVRVDPGNDNKIVAELVISF